MLSAQISTRFNRIGLVAQAANIEQKLTMDAAEAIAAKAQELAPVKEGTLRDGIEAVQVGKDAEVRSTAPHSGFVEFGTRAHTIEGKPLLAFDVDGETVIVRSVHHPGTAAHPFLKPACEAGHTAVTKSMTWDFL